MKNYPCCDKCPFIVNKKPYCETIGECVAEHSSNARYRLTGKVILTNIIDQDCYFEDEVENILTGEKMGRYDDACANEMFGESNNYCYIEPFLVNGKIVSIDEDEIDNWEENYFANKKGEKKND